MSVIVKSKLEISRSPINQSTSKQMFSFAKAPRFPPLKTKGYCDTFYTLPSVAMTRYASFGKGNKSDFTRTSRGMNSQFYAVKRDFDKDNITGPQFSFGISREKYANVYYETNKMVDKNVPGPGKYNYLKSQGFNFFCNVDSTQYWTQITENYVRQGRRNLDGYRMYHNPELVSDLFDAAEVFDKERPTPVASE